MVKLEIIINDDGTMSLNGPIDNLGQCYMMMELAKDVLRSRFQTMQQQVQRPSPLDISLLGKIGNGRG